MELKTPLYDTHVKLGGKIVPFGGYLLPIEYETGMLKEHLLSGRRRLVRCFTYGRDLP